MGLFIVSKKSIKQLMSIFNSQLNEKSDKTHSHSSISGNSATATKLKTARKIGNASFDGTADITLTNMGASASSHTHDDRYYTENEVDNLLTNKSDTDHTHPAQTTISGNAGSATKLATARKIGNASFNGTADITLSQIGAETSGAASTVQTNLNTHTGNKSNPHGVTKSQVGLGNVPNVTTNNQTPTFTVASTLVALTSGETLTISLGKIAKAVSDIIAHIANTSNPHSVSKSTIGLGNVENKSSATIRGELTKANVTTALGYTPPTANTTYSNMTAATASVAGKAGLVPAPAAGAQAKYLRGDGTWQTPTNTTYSNFVKSGSTAKAGLVPAPSTTAGTSKYLREDGRWTTPPDTNTTYTVATQRANGLLSSTDKTKLDGIATGANKYTLPAASSSARGGIKIGYTANGKNYPVQLSNEQAFVNVPWTDNNTTYGTMSPSTASAAGKGGLVPTPAKNTMSKGLRGDGTFGLVDTDVLNTVEEINANTSATKAAGALALKEINSKLMVKSHTRTLDSKCIAASESISGYRAICAFSATNSRVCEFMYSYNGKDYVQFRVWEYSYDYRVNTNIANTTVSYIVLYIRS